MTVREQKLDMVKIYPSIAALESQNIYGEIERDTIACSLIIIIEAHKYLLSNVIPLLNVPADDSQITSFMYHADRN